MCTVTYIPTGKESFILTSNRDESPLRSPENISQEKDLIFPRDIKGGSWICASKQNKLVCLLNGAFQKHRHQPPYPKSRGIIVKEFFDFDSTLDFYKEYNLDGIEPFTMVVWDNGSLYQLRRDEQKTYLTPLDTQSTYLWSSAPLYDFPAKRKRQKWFDDWKNNQTQFTQEIILDFHKNGGEKDDHIGFVMNRIFLRTVSITQVTGTSKKMDMMYYDLIREKTDQKEIPFQ